MILDLKPGVTETHQYKAWKFPGGEIHIRFKEEFTQDVTTVNQQVSVRLTTAENILFFLLVRDTLYKMGVKSLIVKSPYFPYQQADRDFSMEECFSLKTISNLLKDRDTKFISFDTHSDVTPALMEWMEVKTNHYFIETVIRISIPDENLILLSPDAGAYKKIFKLADVLEQKGIRREIASANKSRKISSGTIESIELSKQDFEGRSVLVVDDICMGGRTFVELAKKLQERNVGDLYLAVSHGIFNNGFGELSKYFKRIFTTNSFKDDYDQTAVTVYDLLF